MKRSDQLRRSAGPKADPLRPELPPELPRVEQRLLCRAVDEACRMMGRGDYGAGYRCLHEGYERAREFAELGEPWADELVNSYRTAMLEYCELYTEPIILPSPEVRRARARLSLSTTNRP